MAGPSCCPNSSIRSDQLEKHTTSISTVGVSMIALSQPVGVLLSEVIWSDGGKKNTRKEQVIEQCGEDHNNGSCLLNNRVANLS